MIKAYVYINNVWRRIYNTENISLTAETGGRIPTFSFSLPDKDFRYSIFNTASPYSQYLKKGNQVKITIDDKTVAKGFINDIKYQYPDQIITVQCNGTLSKLQEDVFGGEDWSYESGSFETAIPSSKYIDLSSTGATTVFDVKVNGSYLFSYEWNVTEKKLVIPSDVSGTITGKYFSTVSPHKYFEAILSGYDYALVPLLNGSDTYRFNKLNLVSGADLGNVNDDLTGTGEVITRPIDLGRYTIGFGACSFNDGDFTVEVRGGDTRKILALEGWQPLNNGQNLNSIFARFVRFIQFKITLNNASLDYIDIRLIGNAPNVSGIKFEGVNKFNALQKLAECYQCYLFEDRLGTLRMEHKEIAEDWEEYLPYLQFTNMEVSGIYSPKRVVVNGLEQRFTWLTGDMKGTECIIKCKGAIEFLDEDLVGEIVIDNKCAWDEASLANVALCYQPPRTIIKLNTNRDWELGDLIRVQTNYLEIENIAFSMPFVPVESSVIHFVDVENSMIHFISNVLLEANAIYRVTAKMFKDELTWDYELEEVSRLPFKFYNLYEYYWSAGFGYYDEIVVPTMPEIIYVWDGEDWTIPEFSYDPETGEVTIPSIDIPIEEPDTPIIPGEPIPDKPIVVYLPPEEPEYELAPYIEPGGLYPYYHHWDVWNCNYPIHQAIGEKQWWTMSIEDDGEGWGRTQPTYLRTPSSNQWYSTVPGIAITKFNSDWADYWVDFVNRAASVGERIIFEKGPDDEGIRAWINYGTNVRNLYAITTSSFNPATEDPESIPKVPLILNRATQYSNIDSLIRKNPPFYGLYAEMTTGVLPNSRCQFNCTWETYRAKYGPYEPSITAKGGIMHVKPTFHKKVLFDINASYDLEDYPEYLFKLHRGFTIELELKNIPHYLDKGYIWIFFYLWSLTGSGYRHNFTISFSLPTYGQPLPEYLRIAGSSKTIEELSPSSWAKLRLVLLGCMKYWDPIAQGLARYVEGNLVFNPAANIEHFKDVHETKVKFKGDPDFQGYSAIYINDICYYQGTIENNPFFSSKYQADYYMYYSHIRLNIQPGCEGEWLFNYIKMADKAFDIQSGFDTEHIVTKI